ncbi:hypothetical protein CRUP_021645, partial [Coryphaenoides rupestris]
DHWWARLAGLYHSPQVKFYWNIVSYFAFLLLFAVVLMVDFQCTPSWTEVLLYFWVASLVCEEVRQVSTQRRKRWRWLNMMRGGGAAGRVWYSLISSLTVERFYTGKVLLCIDFIIFCLRLIAIFTISKTLGPKIIIPRW